MAFVAGGFERVVQSPHEFRGPDVNFVFLAECALFDAHDEGKMLDIFTQETERETDFGA